ncbi:TPA: rz1 lytic protein [Escherichia coli]|nr:rz1 lytic protein [Escherichia coli]
MSLLNDVQKFIEAHPGCSLTSETPVPFIPNPLTYGASLELNVSLLSALANCNRDKADIRKIDAERTNH